VVTVSVRGEYMGTAYTYLGKKNYIYILNNSMF